MFVFCLVGLVMSFGGPLIHFVLVATVIHLTFSLPARCKGTL